MSGWALFASPRADLTIVALLSSVGSAKPNNQSTSPWNIPLCIAKYPPLEILASTISPASVVATTRSSLRAERERIKVERESRATRERQRQRKSEAKRRAKGRKGRTSNSRCIMHSTGLVGTAVSSRVLFEIKSFPVSGGTQLSPSRATAALSTRRGRGARSSRWSRRPSSNDESLTVNYFYEWRTELKTPR